MCPAMPTYSGFAIRVLRVRAGSPEIGKGEGGGERARNLSLQQCMCGQ